MKFVLTLHRDTYNAIHVVGLSESIDEGIKLYGLNPKEYNLVFIKQMKRMAGDCLEFELNFLSLYF